MLDEETLILNPLMGSQLIWQCALSYQSENRMSARLPLPLAFLVLPLAMHEDTEILIRPMFTTSGLAHAVHHKAKAHAGGSVKGLDILLGLQDRCVDYADLTWRSLNTALSARFLSSYESTNEGFISFDAAKSLPIPIRPQKGSSVANAMAASKRLGAWFAKQDISATLTVLKVKL